MTKLGARNPVEITIWAYETKRVRPSPRTIDDTAICSNVTGARSVLRHIDQLWGAS